MPIRHAIWKVSTPPQQLPEAALSDEQLLETMIVKEPRILSEEWMLIGRQELTRHGGRVDLVAIAPDASLVLIELKRDRTPREVVAQALDYAAWVEALQPEDVTAIYSRFAPSRSLANDFRERFGQQLDEDELNQSHQIIIVASSLDERTERIVDYLSKHEIPINVLFFQVFANGSEQLLSRAWLLDPLQTQVNAATPTAAPNEPWNGEFYASFGHDMGRSWSEAVKFGFISAGGGEWYSNTLALLSPGDRVWVKAPGYGFVGVGRVKSSPEPASSFHIKTPQGELPALEVLKEGHYHREYVNDPKRSEYFVAMQWLDTLPLEKAINEVGLFGNQNTVCRPKTQKWRNTVDRLKQIFGNYNG